MKRILVFYITISFLIGCNESSSTNPTPTPPNILLIISDDQGWADYSFMGHPHIQTPRLDQLAAESFTFSRGYVTAPLCSPSLASIMSGTYPHQHGVTGNDPAFPFEGKRYGPEWMVERMHQFQPIKQGFQQQTLLTQYLADVNYLSLQTGKYWMGSWKEAHFTSGMTHADPNRRGRHGDEGLTIGREGLQPIQDILNQSTTTSQPFFIWYAPFLPHSPHTPPDSLEQKYLPLAPTPAIAKYWAMCEWFDITCGQILDMIEEKGMTENTLVIYVCDNGWIQEADKPNRYAPRSKRSPYDMGIRTPMMYKWPGKIIPKLDTTSNVSSLDILPTILAATKMEAHTELPGINIMDQQALAERTAVFSEAFDHDIADVNEPTRSLRYRMIMEYPWKLILPDTSNLKEAKVELFNVVEDPYELHNVATEQEALVGELKAKIEDWWTPNHLK